MSALRTLPPFTVVPSIRFAMILATGFEECIEDRLAPAARGRKAGIGLVNAPRHSIKIDLRSLSKRIPPSSNTGKAALS
jgi:hypothetical protein